MNPLKLFADAKRKALQPMLILTPKEIAAEKRLSALGINPKLKLEVRQSSLYVNDKYDGDALKIFDYLQFNEKRTHFFPAFLGIFNYEFARYFGLKTRESLEQKPDAFFYLYEQGYLWINEDLREQPKNIHLSEYNFDEKIPFLRAQATGTDTDFLQSAQIIQENIRAGEVYQVNLSRRYEFDASNLSSEALFNAMLQANPSPFMGIIETDNCSVLSGSPERLFKVHEKNISARPIAGTRPRKADPLEDFNIENQLMTDDKELAEHAMLVDLMRNDLAKIADEPVTIDELYSVERYSHVMHLVSELSTKTSASLHDIFASIFPGGTITGAPKSTVMKLVAELEDSPRAFYTGSMGYISQGFGTDFNILIRSCSLSHNQGSFSAGAGIVIDSDPSKELAETAHKAQSLQALLARAEHGQKFAPPHRYKSQKALTVQKKNSSKILFIENNDSFSYNIIAYLKAAGCSVEIKEQSAEPFIGRETSHIICGPGPGSPYSSAKTLAWVSLALEQKVPFLGICLGHQALGVACGARLIRGAPVHGQAHPIFHEQHPLFSGIKQHSLFARYHSLHLCEVIAPLKVIARLEDGTVMAIAHESKPAFGVQFHPESFLSSDGFLLLNNFLATANEYQIRTK